MKAMIGSLYRILQRENVASPRRRRTGASDRCDTLEPRVLLTALNMSDQEQLIIELINRARANPSAEATRFGISLNQNLDSGTITSTPKQPLAPNQLLVNASIAHSLDMINRDFFNHNNPDGKTPGIRATDAGYNWTLIAENISYGGYFGTPDPTAQVLQSHELLFKSAGHRVNILRDVVEEIGTGIRDGAFIPAGSDATLVTQMFGRRDLNPIITGVVYTDSNNSDFYDIGEAVRAGTVTATRQSDNVVYTESIGTSGGYGIIVPAGTYTVTAEYTLNGVLTEMSTTVTVQSDNVKVDFDTTEAASGTLSLSSPVASINESGPSSSATLTVTRTGSTALPLAVSLASSRTADATVPSSITIPAGSTTATFVVNGVADGQIDGAKNAVITATASNFGTASRTLRVVDVTSPVLPATRTVTTTRPVFTWTPVSNAASYHIYVNNLTTGQKGVINRNGITDTSFTSPVHLPLGNYAVTVRGVTAAGAVGAWSSIAYWNVRPTTAVLNPGRTETSGSFTIRWNPVRGADKYQLWITNQTTGTSPYFQTRGIVGTSFTVSNMEIGRYAVTVRGLSNKGLVSTSSPAAIITVDMAATGLDVSAASLNSNPSVQWNAVPGAALYDVWVTNLTTSVNPYYRNASVPTSNISLTTLTPGRYRIAVRPRDAKGVSYSAAAMFFEFRQSPRFSSQVSFPTERQPMFTWTNVSGATRYQLVIATSASVPILTLSNLTALSYSHGTALAAGSYRAWIRAFDSSGNVSAQSPVLSFTVAMQGNDPVQPDTESLIDLLFESDADRMLSEHELSVLPDSPELMPLADSVPFSDSVPVDGTVERYRGSDEPNFTASVWDAVLASENHGQRYDHESQLLEVWNRNPTENL